MISVSQKKDAFVVFKDLEKDEVISKFYKAIDTCKITDYADFVSALYKTKSTNWSEYLLSAVLSLENCCVEFAFDLSELPDVIQKTTEYELDLLSEMAKVKPEDFEIREHVAQYEVCSIDFKKEYFDRLNNIDKYGFGDFAKYTMFRLNEDEKNEKGFVLKPVKYPDSILFKDLIGYERPRKEIIHNTKILLSGHLASNVLLYGDAGTGKSATVKAVANEYAKDGLRLIELGKEELHLLPKLLDLLSGNPLKFILFVDDLSFQDNDDNFSALKAVLEGSVSVRSKNTVIYATSNRRHIVRETFSSRDGDEVHRQDAMQETISLSERFGIKVYYEKPKKDLYLDIVFGLAKQYNLDIDEKELSLKAEQFALRKAGRSARAARQLIEQLSANVSEEE